MIPSSLVVPDVSVTSMEGVGSIFTVIVVVAVAVQPLTSVTVTVYVVVVVGDLVIAAVDSPVSQV